MALKVALGEGWEEDLAEGEGARSVGPHFLICEGDREGVGDRHRIHYDRGMKQIQR